MPEQNDNPNQNAADEPMPQAEPAPEGEPKADPVGEPPAAEPAPLKTALDEVSEKAPAGEQPEGAVIGPAPEFALTTSFTGLVPLTTGGTVPIVAASTPVAEEPQESPEETEPLRDDGPTLEQYVAAGYPADRYPPRGYAKRETPYVAPAAEATPTMTAAELAREKTAAVAVEKPVRDPNTKCPECQRYGTRHRLGCSLA